MSKRCVIFDIDGTLADCSERRKLLDHDNYHANSFERWTAFFAGIPGDPVIEPVADLLECISDAGEPIILCTGRSETNREATVEWLRKHHISYHALYMRASDCYRPDHIVKSELLDRILADGWRPWIVIDDRQSVVDMWRSRGLVCLQCASGEF